MDMNALFARKFAERQAKGLVSVCGIACATEAERDYRNFRAEMKARPDWGDLPQHLAAKLIEMKRAAYSRA